MAHSPLGYPQPSQGVSGNLFRAGSTCVSAIPRLSFKQDSLQLDEISYKAMEYVVSTYSEEERAWITQEIPLQRDIYLMIKLKRPGKLIIRQDICDGKKPRVPIRSHKNMDKFYIRMRIIPYNVKIQIFTSSEPKEIKYAYI